MTITTVRPVPVPYSDKTFTPLIQWSLPRKEGLYIKYLLTCDKYWCTSTVPVPVTVPRYVLIDNTKAIRRHGYRTVPNFQWTAKTTTVPGTYQYLGTVGMVPYLVILTFFRKENLEYLPTRTIKSHTTVPSIKNKIPYIKNQPERKTSIPRPRPQLSN